MKYAKEINPETFESYIMVDDQDESLKLAPMKMEFSLCGDAEDGIKLLGLPFSGDTRDSFPSHLNLLQIDCEDEALEGLRFYDCGLLNIMLSERELDKGWWHSSFGVLSSL